MSNVGPVGSGQLLPADQTSDYNKINFQIKQLMVRMRTMIPVKIMGVNPQSGQGSATQGAVAGAGFVSVKPEVSMVDGDNTAVQHGTIYNIPYTRIYGGNNAVIMDPVVGDIGYMVVADRDISSFKQNVSGGSTNSSTITPGSNRKYDLADGIYIGGVMNKTPTQYITFKNQGITINDSFNNMIVMDGTGIKLQDKNGNIIQMESGNIKVTTSDLQVTGAVHAGFGTGDQIGLQTHLHDGVTAGGDDTTAPIPGT
jgi:hypothetical protein